MTQCMVRPCVARGFHRSVGFAVLHQCIRPLIEACCALGHHGYQRACALITGQAWNGPFGSPGLAGAGKTGPPSRFILSQISLAEVSDLPYSALMFAARITSPHFSVSAVISLPKSMGEPASTVPPNSASRAFILESSNAALISLLSLLTISAGVSLGAPKPPQKLASKPGRNSLKVGMPGKISER